MSPSSGRPAVFDRPVDLAFSYTRFSTDSQESIAEQDAINDEISLEYGVPILRPFSDEGLSRSLSERPGLRQLFAAYKAHPEVGFLITNELERLTAGVSQRSEIVQMCKALRVTILTEDMGRIDPFDDDKMQEADQRAISSQGEVLKIRRRTRRNLRQKVLAGTVAMRPPYGVQMKPLVGPDGQELPSGMRLVDAKGKSIASGELQVHPDEIDWLRRIFEWSDAGASNDEICRRLDAAGVPTKGGRGTWRGNTVAGILQNPFYKGDLVWGHRATIRDADGKSYLEVRDADDPGRVRMASPLGAIIEPAVWERIEARRLARTNGARRGRRRKYGPQVFDDLVYCGRCGYKMYGRNDGGDAKIIWRYYCNSGRPGHKPRPGFETTCAKGQSMSEKQILAAIRSLGEVDMPDAVAVRRTRDVTAALAQKVVLEKAIADLEAERRRAVSALLAGHITEDEFAAAKREREGRSAPLRVQLDLLGADLDDADAVTSVQPDMTRQLAELADLLADKSIGVTEAQAALASCGVRRIYVDSPRVQMDLVL